MKKTVGFLVIVFLTLVLIMGCSVWEFSNPVPGRDLVDYGEFHKPLGAPKGDAAKSGWIYTRSFKHADVRVDLSKRTARIEWIPR